MPLNKYEACLAKKKVNHSRAREAIFKIFTDNMNTFLSVSKLKTLLEQEYPKKVSINTIYRHLSFFVSCDLVLLVQDDNKKAYYILMEESESPVFTICPSCQAIGFEKVREDQREVLCELIEFKEGKKAPFIVIHKICPKCK